MAAAGCGGSNGHSTTGRATDVASAGGPPVTISRNYSTHNNDRDNDGDHNDDDEKVLYYGHAANAADRQSSIALVTRYLAAAAAEDGAAGCRMLAPVIAESIVED